MNNADRTNERIGLALHASGRHAANLQALKAKGSCWYCNQPLDNVRRFCNKACADDYLAEEEALNNQGLSNK